MPMERQVVLAAALIECVVLARAPRWHVEHCVLINGPECVLFR